MVEAALSLALALVLVRLVRIARWSRLFPAATPAADGAGEPSAYAVAVAIGRAERRLLRRPVKCLPRAMAAHWMLRRRGVASRLVIGGTAGRYRAPVLEKREFHAWIECGGAHVDVGRREAAVFVPILIVGQR